MTERDSEIAEALRNLANRVETDGLRTAEWSARYEIIELAPSGDFRECRPGPRVEYTILFDWANIEPANIKGGERSRDF